MSNGDGRSSSEALALRLREEVDSLLRRHRSELDACLEHWVHDLRDQSQIKKCLPVTQRSCLSKQVVAVDGDTHEVMFDEPIKVEYVEAVVSEGAGVAFTSSSTSRSRLSTTSASGRGRPSTASVLAKRRGRQKSKECFLPASESGIIEEKTALQMITTSRLYEFLSGVLILLNGAFIGWQTQYLAHAAMDAAVHRQPPEREEPLMFVVIQGCFTLLFTFELALRWVADGMIGFFHEADRWWNFLDVIVVAFSLVDLFIEVVLAEGELLSHVSVLRVLRVIRIVRVVKVIRILKFFRELRMMIFAIVRSLKAMLWVMLVLLLTFYIFGIVFTVATTTQLTTLEDWTGTETQSLRAYFATLDRSCLTLFMAMSGGKEWNSFYDALERLPHPYRMLFLIYITFSIFAVFNIVTGVFVECALQSNNQDKIITAHEELEVKKAYLKAMCEIFEEMDEDGSGVVSLEAFEAKLSDERVIAYFNAMKLDVTDARNLFVLIDHDRSGNIDIQEFVEGCHSLQGESRTLDMKLMQCAITFLRDRFVLFEETLSRIGTKIEEYPAMARSECWPELVAF